MQGAHNEHLQKCQRWKLWVFAQLITLVSSTRTYNPPFKYEDIQYSDTWLWSWMYLKAELKTFMLQLQGTNIWKLNERAEIKTPEQSKQIIVGWLSRFIENSDDLLKVSGWDWFVQTLSISFHMKFLEQCFLGLKMKAFASTGKSGTSFKVN